MCYAIFHSFQSYGAKEKDDEDNIGINRSYIDDHWTLRDSLDNAQVDQDPGDL